MARMPSSVRASATAMSVTFFISVAAATATVRSSRSTHFTDPADVVRTQ
jgi:hypothetical protein